MQDRMLLNSIQSSATYGGRLKYRKSGYGWEWDKQGNLPSIKGVYFLLSKHGIEKVGSANGKFGLKGRIRQYTRKNKKLPNDATDILWNRIMSNELLNEYIDVYYIVIEGTLNNVHTSIGTIEVISCPILEVETSLFYQAKNQAEPMRLAGKSP
jgi:hypothetical protein